ncbi:uncharacterized protein At1g76660-like [Zingiber officinale]|uniref:Hydroxyproline-rich glycoprotein family protein n=1 Tax=Zingiber officinale TaxID=94328 RepID=A0A8J5LCC3_ZINOF|nr:uncharacterized protein At1g76660-like [Zingiber officinale]KAG6513094.1 hypothetical protein ZIOFF_023401 [Zingiber officinale]
MAANDNGGAGTGGGGEGSGRGAGGSPVASITNAPAATAIGSAELRLRPQERWSRWGGCFGGLSCFGSQKRGKRIVPASRTPDGNASSSRVNGPQSAGISSENTILNLSILAPPSSPASFTNSALPSTAQSPNCLLSMSAISPGGPSSTMFATGPYAHETQLVSPPVFSTFTTEPSTAPLTPPPELAHLTTPSSPDVPFARFLSSSLNIRSATKDNGMPYLSSNYVGSEFQTNYPFYPGSPSSSLISPATGTPRTGISSPFPERDTPRQWDASASAQDSPCCRNGASKLFGLNSAATRNFILCPDSSFFYPATSAQFHLDQAQQSVPHSAGRHSMSREADVHSSGNRHSKACKQDAEEIEAYRASFGFSADEIVTTQHYVEMSNEVDESFTMSPFANTKTGTDLCRTNEFANKGKKLSNSLDPLLTKQVPAQPEVGLDGSSDRDNIHAGSRPNCLCENASPLLHGNTDSIGGEGGSSRSSTDPQLGKRAQPGQSFSDAEIDYRRARSLREANTALTWRNLLIN